jgi:hypothetical protein
LLEPSGHGRIGGRKDLSRNAPLARLLAATLAVLVGITLTAAPVAAAPAQPTIAAAAKAQVDAVPAASLAQTAAAPAQAPAAPSKSFFKSGKGAFAGVLLAGMLGYTVYSFSNDRVKSPAK